MPTQDNTLHRAAVITPGHVYYGDGTFIVTRTDITRDLVAILRGTAGRFWKWSTIVVDGTGPSAWSLVQLAALKDAGWSFGTVAESRERLGVVGAWTLFHRPDGTAVAVGCREIMKPPHLGVLFRPGDAPEAVARLLHWYSEATGNAWRGTPATSALAHIRLTWGNDRYQPLWNLGKIGPGWGVGPLVWSRPLTPEETAVGTVHTWDANSAYLGAAINAEVAWSRLTHTGPQPFDQAVPGYWQIQPDLKTFADDQDPDRPPLLGRVRDGLCWVTTPYAKFLQDRGDRVEVVDSWTGQERLRDDGTRVHPAQSRVLRKWGERMRDAVLAVDRSDPMAAPFKRTYKDAVGGMQRAGMRIDRPDWAHTVIDLWRATLLRRVYRVHAQTGLWPVAIRTDSISYAVPDHRSFGEIVGVPLDPSKRLQLGQWRHQSVTPVAEWSTRSKRATR